MRKSQDRATSSTSGGVVEALKEIVNAIPTSVEIPVYEITKDLRQIAEISESDFYDILPYICVRYNNVEFLKMPFEPDTMSPIETTVRDYELFVLFANGITQDSMNNYFLDAGSFILFGKREGKYYLQYVEV